MASRTESMSSESHATGVTASLRPRDRLEDEETYAFKEWEPGERFGIMMAEDEDASASQEWEPEVRFSYDPGSTTRRN
jgi:hypothetical protein